MKRVALYVRVSSQEQKLHGLSVDSQILALQEHAKEKGYQIVDIYNDAGISAHAPYKKRPELLRMIADCQANLVDLVLFTKLDRFFRSVADYYAVMEQMGKPWQAIWEDYETQTSNGVFKVNIMLSIAQAEAERTGERIKAVYDYKRAQGWYIGTPPMGYKVVDHYLVKDEKMAPYVELMFKTYLQTFSTRKTAQVLADAGCPYTNVNGISNRLKSETYCGNANGSPCEPYITWEQHEEIIDNLKKYVRITDNRRTYIFSGMMTCTHCGCRMHSKTTVTPYSTCQFYICRGNVNTKRHDFTVSISERKVETFLLNNVDEYLREYNAEIEYSDGAKDLKKKEKALKQRLDRVGMRFELGDISVEEFKQKREEITHELQALQFRLRPTKQIELPSDWKQVYADLTPEHKQVFWRSIIDKIYFDKEKTLRIIWKS